MNPELKAKLEALRLKPEEELSDAEKSELSLLTTVEKQATQIAEKDSMIGAKGTELDDLKKSIESKTGAEKADLESQLASKQEALEAMKFGLDALKDAHKLAANAVNILPEKPGHGDAVDPEEVEALEAKAQSDPATKSAVEELYKELEPADKLAYKKDPAFKKLLLESVVGNEGEETDDTPWAKVVKKEETDETATQRYKRIFGQQQKSHSKMPLSSSGRSSRGRKGLPGMPQAEPREVDLRSQ